MKVKYFVAAVAAVILIVQMPAQAGEAWIRSTEMQWGDVGAHGPGTAAKVLLSKENGFLDDRIRVMLLVKVAPGGEYRPSGSLEEDYAVFVARGAGQVSLKGNAMEAKPGDSYGIPAGIAHSLRNTGSEPIELVVYAAPVTAINPEAKPVIGKIRDMEWQVNDTHGPGCELKMVLGRGFSKIIRGMWVMKVGPGGLNYMHSGGEHQLFYIWEAPVPNPTPRDDRTAAGWFILKDKAVQTVAGDAFYAGGAPARDKHAFFNESHDAALTYLAIGVPVPAEGLRLKTRGSVVSEQQRRELGE